MEGLNPQNQGGFKGRSNGNNSSDKSSSSSSSSDQESSQDRKSAARSSSANSASSNERDFKRDVKNDSPRKSPSTEKKIRNPYYSSSSESVAAISDEETRKRSRSRQYSRDKGHRDDYIRKDSYKNDNYKSRSSNKSRRDSFGRNSDSDSPSRGGRRRYSGRRSPPDYGRGSYRRGRSNKESEPIIPDLDVPLYSYKNFMEIQKAYLPRKDAEKLYNDYKKKYEDKHMEIFFTEHKEEHWFKEKYDPLLNYKWKNERIEQAKSQALNFFSLLQNNHFEGLKLQLSKSEDSKMEDVQDNENEQEVKGVDIMKAPYFGFDANSMTLYLKSVPVKISRWDLLNVVRQTPGFVSLSMSEPLKNQNFVRYVWVAYDSEDNCGKSIKMIENLSIHDFQLNPVKSFSTPRNIKVTPPLCYNRMSKDLQLTKNLIHTLDKEKQIENNLLFSTKEERDEAFQLDLQLLYLRRVHAYCFYCCEEYDDERMLASKCGPNHIRSHKTLSESELQNYLNSVQFEQKLDVSSEARSEKSNKVLKHPEDDEKLKKSLDSYVVDNVCKIEEDKWACGVCEKLFEAAHFLEKHVKTRHREDLENIKAERFENMLFENYKNDPNKFTNQPSMQGPYYQGNGSSAASGGRGYNSKFRRKGKNYKNENTFIDYDDPGMNNTMEEDNGRSLISYDDL